MSAFPQDAPLGRLKQTGLILGLAILMLGGTLSRAVEPLTAADVIARGEDRFRSLEDYECMVDIDVKLGRKAESGSGRFWFKQPRMLRVRVTRGSGNGSDVAVDSEGKIRGRKRGILSFIVKRLKTSDRRLHTIRGTSMLELDWGSFFLRYHAAALRPDAAITLAPRTGPEAPYQVVVTYPDLGKSMREVYSLDPLQWTIVEGELYENDIRVEHVVFREIKLNTGVPERWFHL